MLSVDPRDFPSEPHLELSQSWSVRLDEVSNLDLLTLSAGESLEFRDACFEEIHAESVKIISNTFHMWMHFNSFRLSRDFSEKEKSFLWNPINLQMISIMGNSDAFVSTEDVEFIKVSISKKFLGEGSWR